MKILYIPADNISANFSRSYHIAKNLSNHCDLYRLRWNDNRSALWKGKKKSVFNTFKCFISSLLQSFKVEKSDEFGYDVYSSIFLSAFIGRIIGKYNALVWMRKYNYQTLKKIAAKIQPDIIFHADGFYFFPALDSSIPEFSDLQDDINWKNFPPKNLNDIYAYYTNQFNKCKLNFIVSESAKKSITNYIKAEFFPISNGADFSAIKSINEKEINEFKQKFNIPLDKKIASYIGGAHKFDEEFTKKIALQAEKELSNLAFIVAGNIPAFKVNNVFFTGVIPNKEANILYALSDIGLTLRDTANNDFIYNSVPLKFIQYAAAKKPVVTFPIKWSVDNNFPSVFHINNDNPKEWVSKLNYILNEFQWETKYNEIWDVYDWKYIILNLFTLIEKNK